MLASEYFEPLGLPERVLSEMRDKTPEQAWTSHTEGRWLLSAATRLSLHRATVGELLMTVAPSAALERWLKDRDTIEARVALRAYLRLMAMPMPGQVRRYLYAQYSALRACIASDREAAACAEAAIAYAGKPLDPDKVREWVPWKELERLASRDGTLDRIRQEYEDSKREEEEDPREPDSGGLVRTLAAVAFAAAIGVGAVLGYEALTEGTQEDATELIDAGVEDAG